MASPATVFSENASSMLLQPLIREYTDQLRNQEQKHRDEIENLKVKNIAVNGQLEAKTNQLEAKVNALTEENEKLKTELATGSTAAMANNMDLFLKGLKTLNAKALKQETALESINKPLEDNENKTQQHTKTVQDSIVASAEVINAQGKDAMDSLKAIECMQTLSDSRTASTSYDEVSKLSITAKITIVDLDRDSTRENYLAIL
jgi:vacuolar-type H+-ATPase subunit I/STV1